MFVVREFMDGMCVILNRFDIMMVLVEFIGLIMFDIFLKWLLNVFLFV